MELYIPYCYLAVLRIVLVFVPQTGYIHPDEHFQSTEVLAGRILDVAAKTPWEFNATFPVRSITVPYLTVGFCLKMLKNVEYFAKEYFNSTVLTPYFILVFPRILMCMLSFLVDYSIYKICVNNNEKYKSRLLILASSYVLVVYGTRTFSNTMELILFSVLLYYVSESMTFTNMAVKNREYVDLRYKKAKNPVDKVKWNKLRSLIKSDSLRNCFKISTLTVIGFFNRPTFLAYAISPVFFWLYRGIGSKAITVLEFHLRSLMLLLCAVPVIFFFIIVDSFYYGYISWGEIGVLDVTINSFVFTPLNFVKYNLNSKNLAQHGLHSRFLHVLVNVPLLFNILGVYGIAMCVMMIYRFARCQYSFLPTVRSLKGLMVASMVTPVAVLSIFPHQEPRFLIPILLPLAYLTATNIIDEPDHWLAQITKKTTVTATNTNTGSQRKIMFKVWIVLNALLAVFYGFIHQGGVFPAISYLAKEIRGAPNSTVFHVVSSHNYMIPDALLARPKYSGLFVYEEGSHDLEYLLNKLENIVASKGMVYLIIPTSLREELQHKKHKVKFHCTKSFYPHLSTEAFPQIFDYCLDLLSNTCGSENTLSLYAYFSKIVELFGLDLYRITEEIKV